MKIIIDTNFLIYCAKEKLDYIEEINNLVNEKYELVVPLQVIEELERLKTKAKKGKDKRASDLAMQILEKNIKEKLIKKVKVEGETVDQGIINLANEDKKNIVATLDREMRQILGRVILLNRGMQLMLTK
jgi:rRNA-processing protein FCF1